MEYPTVTGVLAFGADKYALIATYGVGDGKIVAGEHAGVAFAGLVDPAMVVEAIDRHASGGTLASRTFDIAYEIPSRGCVLAQADHAATVFLMTEGTTVNRQGYVALGPYNSHAVTLLVDWLRPTMPASAAINTMRALVAKVAVLAGASPVGTIKIIDAAGIWIV